MIDLQKIEALDKEATKYPNEWELFETSNLAQNEAQALTQFRTAAPLLAAWVKQAMTFMDHEPFCGRYKNPGDGVCDPACGLDELLVQIGEGR